MSDGNAGSTDIILGGLIFDFSLIPIDNHPSTLLSAIIDAMDMKAELRTKALNSAEIPEWLKRIMLNQRDLSDKLRARGDAA